jgi:hypothetical protein
LISEWYLPFRFSNQNILRSSHISHVCYMPRPSHRPRFDRPNICWTVQVTKLLIMQSSPSSHHFLPFYVQIFSSAPCSRTFSICVLPLAKETKFTTHKKQNVTVNLFLSYRNESWDAV